MFLASCSGHLTPNQPVVIANDVETRDAPREARADAQAWTYFMLLSTELPTTGDEVDDLQADSPYSASVHGRLVWLDLHGKSARDRLGTVRGPISITLRDLDPEVLRRIDELAKHYPVAIFYKSKPAPAPRSDDEVQVAEEDLSALGSLRHVQSMVLWIEGEPDFPDLRRCAGLKRLDALALGASDEIFDRMPPQIEELSATGAWPSSGKALQHLRKLRRLSLFSAKAVTIRDLAPLKELEDLTLADELTDADLENLKAFPKLRSFESRSQHSSAAIAYLAELPNLRALGLRLGYLNDAGVAQLASMNQLEALTPPESFSSDDIASLAALKNLRTLDLSGSEVSASALERLATLKHLEGLYFSSSELTDAIAPSIAKLTNLRRLDLGNSKVGDATANSLRKLTKLRQLSLRGTGITSAAVPALLELKELRSLDVEKTNLNSDGVLALLALPNLHRYYASVSESDHETLTLIQRTQKLLVFPNPRCDTPRLRVVEAECEDR